jgi:transcriptional regulator with XRE-family HTH domain
MPKPQSVAQYLTEQIERSGKTQLEIAHECGFTNANVITMIKQGKSKLPLTRVDALAKALDVDVVYLLSLTMREYEPELWKIIEQKVLHQPVMTATEVELVGLAKEAGLSQRKLTSSQREKIAALLMQLKKQ